MNRRKFIANSAGFGFAVHPFVRSLQKITPSFSTAGQEWKLKGPRKPVFIYNDWSAYDELSDNVALTEELAMREMNEIVRLKKNGVQLDYFVMDAFWFDVSGGYRTWDKKHWPDGPAKWFAACRQNDLKPGMWFSTNLVSMSGRQALDIIPEWKDSVGTDPNILCLFEGGYLEHLAASLQIWYDQGVRLFKFDFAYFEAVTPASKNKYTPEQVKEKNKTAFMDMLQRFRKKNDDILITGYNGFGGDMENTFTVFKKTVDDRWLEVFDTLYCGDPRFSDVPMMNIWRSQDNYSDHMARQFQFNGLPIYRIDNCAFMIGKTGTCYYRELHCWKGMLILELARGGWVNVYHGNLELLSDSDAEWFAKTQSLFHELQKENEISSFGPIPGLGKPYGFKARSKKGEVFTVINPSQEMAVLELETSLAGGRILYADGGYTPSIKGNSVTLGPEQLVVVGFGGYAAADYEMGTDDSIHIPDAIQPVAVSFTETTMNEIRAKLNPVTGSHLRILFQQFELTGLPRRSWGGAPPSGTPMNALLKINVNQEGIAIPLHIEYDKMIWCGLSWGAAELDTRRIDPTKPLEIVCSSAEKDKLMLKASVYEVKYSKGL